MNLDDLNDNEGKEEFLDKDKKKIFVLVGPPSVGKSTWISKTFQGEQPPYVINRDDLAEQIASQFGWTYDEMFMAPPADAGVGDENEKYGTVVQSPSWMTWQPLSFSKVVEANDQVQSEFMGRVAGATAHDGDIVVDMTNMNEGSRKQALDILGDNKDEYYKVAVVFKFQGLEDLIMKVAEKRAEVAKEMGKSKTIPAAAFKRMFAAFQDVSKGEGFDEIVSVDNTDVLKSIALNESVSIDLKRWQKNAGLLKESISYESRDEFEGDSEELRNKEIAYSVLSDTYKDLNGIRPRGIYDFDNMSLEDITAETDMLYNEYLDKVASDNREFHDPKVPNLEVPGVTVNDDDLGKFLDSMNQDNDDGYADTEYDLMHPEQPDPFEEFDDEPSFGSMKPKKSPKGLRASKRKSPFKKESLVKEHALLQDTLNVSRMVDEEYRLYVSNHREDLTPGCEIPFAKVAERLVTNFLPNEEVYKENFGNPEQPADFTSLILPNLDTIFQDFQDLADRDKFVLKGCPDDLKNMYNAQSFKPIMESKKRKLSLKEFKSLVKKMIKEEMGGNIAGEEPSLFKLVLKLERLVDEHFQELDHKRITAGDQWENTSDDAFLWRKLNDISRKLRHIDGRLRKQAILDYKELIADDEDKSVANDLLDTILK